MKQEKKVLIVEDDNLIAQMLKELLIQNQYEIENAYSGTEALLLLEQKSFDVILLDLMLPGLNGVEVLSKIRETSSIPIIAISAMDSIQSKVTVLKKGADDYITKPFHNEELLVRMETVLRRGCDETQEKEELHFKNLVLNVENREVKVNNQKINLTKNEYNILKMLMENPNKIITKNNIFEAIWKEDYFGEDNTINVHISNIRKKIAVLDKKEEYIQTVWGIGFKMNQEKKV